MNCSNFHFLLVYSTLKNLRVKNMGDHVVLVKNSKTYTNAGLRENIVWNFINCWLLTHFIAVVIRVGKITCFCFNYDYKYNYKQEFSFFNYNYNNQVQVIVIQLQLQWKDSQNFATNSLTYEASSIANVNTVDLFCISIPNPSKPHFSLSLFFHQSLFKFNFCNT